MTKKTKKRKGKVSGGLPRGKGSGGQSRRGFIKKAVVATAVGAAATVIDPKVVLGAQGGGLSPVTEDEATVTAVDILNSTNDMVLGLTGVSPAIQTSISAELLQARGYVASNDGSWAQLHLDAADALVDTNLVALNAANGGVADPDVAAAGHGSGLGMIGDAIKGILTFLRALGNAIRDFICRLRKLICVKNCTVTFISCTGQAGTKLAACFGKCKALLAIPFIGKGLYALCIVVCLVLGAIAVAACYSAFKSCKNACGTICNLTLGRDPSLATA